MPYTLPMSSFARAAAAASFIRRRRGYYLCGGISLPSSCFLLWRRSISSNSIVSGENANPNHSPDHQQSDNDNDDPNPNSRKQEEAPWLLLSSPTKPQSRYLYDLTIGLRDRNDDDDLEIEIEFVDKKLNRELHLPDIAERIFIGSSKGFLVSINKSALDTVHAFNPLTGSHLPTPRLPPILCHPYNREDGLNVDPIFPNVYGTKAILSPSLDTIVILPNPKRCHGPVLATLPSSSTSSFQWTVLDDCWYLYEGIFHKGLLHATNNEGELYIFDDLKPKRLAACPMIRQPFLRNSLVESPDGDDLFLVYRTIDGDTLNDPYPGHLISLFKLRFDQKKKAHEWDQVESVGDLAFFVGTKSSSLSLDVSDHHLFPSVKSNSVYFSDTWSVGEDGLDPKMLGRAGVYCLENKTFHYIELSDGAHGQLNWPPPVWYMPANMPATPTLNNLSSFKYNFN